MKKIAIFLILVQVLLIFSVGCANTTGEQGKLLRIHIRAHSNDSRDQSVKMRVKEAVTDLLGDRLKSVVSLDEAIAVVEDSKAEIERVSNSVLKKNGFCYKAKAHVRQEYFPTRLYEGIEVEAGVYDAVIVELGEAKGDNWWCVIYPPLCFVGRSEGEDFKYKSKIAELWRKFVSSF